MPPRMASRSAIAPPARRVGTEGAVLVAGVTGVMAQREGAERLLERAAQAGVRGVDQDRADEDAAVGDDATVVAQEEARVEALHHLRGDALVVVVAALALDLGTEP